MKKFGDFLIETVSTKNYNSYLFEVYKESKIKESMSSFVSYLLEETYELDEAAGQVSSDDKGKLHELLLAKHLSGHFKKEASMPDHFRGDASHPNPKLRSKSPQEVHDEIQSRIHPDDYDIIDQHSKKQAQAIIDYAKKTGRIKSASDLSGVHWTSNADTVGKAGDHEKLTGKKDVNSDADLIMTTKDGNFIPISAKYGGNEKPNLRNSGLESLEQLAGLEPDTLGQHRANLERELISRFSDRHGDENTSQVERHGRFKIDRDILQNEMADYKKTRDRAESEHLASGGKKKDFNYPDYSPEHPGAQAAMEAMDISLRHRSNMAADLAKGFQNMHEEAGSDEPLRRIISHQASPERVIPHIVSHAHVQPDGSSNPVIHEADSFVKDHLANFNDIKAVHGSESSPGNGTTVTFYGTHKKSGRRMPIARQTLKASSGPYKGVAGTFTLENLGKGDEPPARKAAKKTKPEKIESSGEIHGMKFKGPSE